MNVQQVLVKLLPTSASHYVLTVKYLCNRNPPATPPAGTASQTNSCDHACAAPVLARSDPDVHSLLYTRLCFQTLTQGNRKADILFCGDPVA